MALQLGWMGLSGDGTEGSRGEDLLRVDGEHRGG